jgi:hypothetical protein
MTLPSGSRSTRRELLETALGLGTVGLAGCQSRPRSSRRNTSAPSETEARSSPAGPSRTTSPSTPSHDGRHDFWISNRTGTDRRVEITVVRAGTDETVLDGCYESPAGLSIRSRDVGEEDVTYDVTATTDGGDTLGDQWVPDACPEAYTGLYGTDGGVVIDGDSVSFTQNECDYATVGDEVPEIGPDDVESCAGSTSQSVTTSSPSRTSTG